MHALCSAALLSTLVLFTLPAAADPSAADKTAAAADVQKANAAAKDKRFRAAAELYESAYRKAPDPKTLFSAASAWQKNGDSTKAANAYARFLKDAPEKAPSRDKARKELDALAPKLGQLIIKADGASSAAVDGEAVDLPPPPVLYVNPGAHELVARFGDKSATEKTNAPAGAITNVTLAAPVEVKAPASPQAVARIEPPPPPAEDKRKPLPPLAVYVGAGATVIAGGLTALSALDTSSQKDTFDGERSQANLDAGKSKQLRTNVLLAVTGGVAVVTGVFAIFLVDWKGRSGENVKVGVGPGSFVLQSTF